ncbi:o-succinylbenzoate synthase [candidate division KSB1 bacterium]|nr:o-succinylbenzoate synthase [candidate division KSB1 bacterium]
MRPPRLTWTNYALPLREPVQTARGTIVRRDGVLIALRDDDGITGIGDAAPDSRFGSETLDELRSALAGLQFSAALPPAVNKLPEWLQACGVSPYVHPALSFALESAALAMLCQRLHTPLHVALRAGAPAEVMVNALIGGASSPQRFEQAEAALRGGFHVLKFKCGGRGTADEVAWLRRVTERHPTVEWRADANGRWSLPEALAFCTTARGLPLEYIEDPLAHAHPESLALLRRETGVRIALDESSRDDVWRAARIANRVFHTLIIKPTIFGITTRAPALIAKAASAGMRVVMSSFYESSVGLSYVAAAAAALPGPTVAHGIGTATHFSEDVTEDPLLPESGMLRIPDVRELPGMLRSAYLRKLQLS